MKICLEINLDEGMWAEDYARRNGSIAMPDDVVSTLVEAIRDWARPAHNHTTIDVSVPLA